MTLPDISGTWVGEMKSLWVDPRTGKTTPPIPAQLTVSQTFSGVQCVMRTGEMTSRSYCSTVDIDDHAQLRRLAYTYASEPRIAVRDRSAPHDGTCSLEIIAGTPRRLVGKYWTERNTAGEIRLIFHSRDRAEELLPEIADASGVPANLEE